MSTQNTSLSALTKPVILRDIFQPIAHDNRDIFLYSAYLDPRFAHSVNPISVRVLALSRHDTTGQFVHRKRYGNNLVCQVNFYKDKYDTNYIKKFDPMIVITNVTCNMYGGTGLFRYNTFECDMTATNQSSPNFLPVSVSIGVKSGDTVNTFESWLPVDIIPYPKAINFSHPGVNINISACVKGMHDFDRHNRLIEYIEAQAMFGVNHFYIYYMSASPKVNAVLQWYAAHSNETRRRRTNDGIEEFHLTIELISWLLPAEIDIRINVYERTKAIAYFGQQLSENDCLMRSAVAGFTHAVRTDIDEFLLPMGNHSNWHDFMLTIYRSRPKERINAIAAACLWFDPGSYYNDSNHNSIETLTVFRYVTRSFDITMGFIKSIADLRYIVFTDIHFVLQWEPGTIMYQCNHVTECLLYHYRYADITNRMMPHENRSLNYDFLKYNTSAYRHAIYRIQNELWKLN